MVRIRRLLAAVVFVGLGIAAAALPTRGVFDSFAASCRDVRVYDGGTLMIAWCRRPDGGWRFVRIVSCGSRAGKTTSVMPRCSI